jgi:hypothetical protein
MIKIKHETNHACHIDGFVLYINGKKTHSGLWPNIKILRHFWNNYRALICAGYIQELSGNMILNGRGTI